MTQSDAMETPRIEVSENDAVPGASDEQNDVEFFASLLDDIPENPLARNRAWHRENLASLEGIACRNFMSEPVRFNMLSMPQWLAIADAARVPFVPATMIAEVPTDTFEDFFSRQGQDNEGHPFNRFDEDVICALNRDGSEVLRFEHIAPAEVKANRSDGAPMGCGIFWSDPLHRWLVPTFDERFYTTLLDFAPEDIRAYVRPTVKTEDVPGEFRGQTGYWPVEFRVFVEDMKVIGVSNYYPQVALHESYLFWARDAVRLARDMIAVMRRKRIGVGNARLSADVGDMHRKCDITPEHWGPQDFTLDFILDRNAQRLLFLEGGPAGIQAAHPCCFLGHFGEELARHPLGGVILSDGGDIYPLDPAEGND